MSVTAAQLVAEISISGVDAAVTSLNSVGNATTTVQEHLDMTGNAAESFAEMFQMASENMAAALDVPIAQISELQAEAESALTNVAESADNAAVGMDDMGAQSASAGSELIDVLMQINESIQNVQFAVEGMQEAVTGGLDDLYSKADEATQALDNLDSAANNTAEAISQVGSEASATSNGGFMDLVNKIGFGIFNFQNFLNIAGQVTQGLLGPAVSAETVTTALTTLDGSASKAAKEMANLNAFAAKTPFKTLDIDTAAEQLQGFGINAKNVIPEITAIGDALGSVGRDTPAELDSVVQIFGKIHTEGKLTAATMNELAIHGINGWQALADATGKTIPQVKDMVKQGLIPADQAINDLTKGIEMNPLYKGGMAKAASTFSGLLSTLQSNWDQVIAAFGTPIIKALEGNLNNIGDILASPSFQSFAGGVGQGLVNVFGLLGKTVDSVVKYFGAFDLRSISYSFKNLGDTVSDLLRPLTNLGSNKAAMEFFTNLKNTLSQGIVQAIRDVSTFINGLAKNLQALGSNKAASGFLNDLKNGLQQVGQIVGGQLGQNFQLFGHTVQDLGKWWQSTMMPAIQQAMPGFEHLASVVATNVVPALAKIWAVGQQVAREVLPPLTKAFETVAPIVVKVGGFLADNLGKALQFIMPFALQAAQAIGQFAGEIITRVIPIVQNLWNGISAFLNWIAPYWPAIWGTIQTVFTSVWDTLKGVIQIAWSIISGIIKVGLDVLSGNWKQAWNDIKSMFSGVWDGMKSIAKGAWDLVQAPIMNGVHALQNWWNSTWNTIKSDFGNAWNGMQSLVSGAWNNISGAVKGGINNVIGMINGFINHLDGIHISLPGGGSVGFNIPDIPYLASGGMVTQGGFAVVGEEGPENVWLPAGAQVIPNSQSFGFGNQQPIVVQAILQVDGRMMANGLLPHMVNAIRYGTGIKF